VSLEVTATDRIPMTSY